MLEKDESTPAINPDSTQPSWRTSPAPPDSEAYAKAEASAKYDYSAFAALLGPSATPEQVQKFFEQMTQMFVVSLQKDAQKAHQASEEMKKTILDQG